MRTPTALMAIAIAMLAGSAAPARPDRASDEAAKDLAKALAGRIPGKPVNCIDNQMTGGPQVVDDHTILYRETNRRVWRNDLPAACPSMDRFSTLIVTVYGGQLCRNDLFRTIDNGSRIPSALCRMGSFTPYDLPPKAKK